MERAATEPAVFLNHSGVATMKVNGGVPCNVPTKQLSVRHEKPGGDVRAVKFVEIVPVALAKVPMKLVHPPTWHSATSRNWFGTYPLPVTATTLPSTRS